MSTTTIRIARPRGAHRAATGLTTDARRLFGAAVRLTGDLLLVASVLALLALAVGPRVLPYRTTTMLTGSMAPLIDPGDVAVLTAEPVADVRIGQILQILQIQAPTPDHRVVTHRVVAVRQDGDGSVSIRTKGDANQGEDPWLAKLEGGTAWQYRGTVPHLGTAIRALRHPLVRQLLVLVVPAGLAGWVLLGLWRRDPS